MQEGIFNLLENNAAILSEYGSAKNGPTPIPIPTPTPRSWKIGVGIGIGGGIEKSTHRPPCFAKYFVSSVEKPGPNAMNHIQLELLKTMRASKM